MAIEPRLLTQLDKRSTISARHLTWNIPQAWYGLIRQAGLRACSPRRSIYMRCSALDYTQRRHTRRSEGALQLQSHLRRVRLLRIHGPRVAVLAVRMCRHCRVHALVARHRRPDVKIYVKVAPLVRVQVGVFICASRASLLRNCGDKCPLGADVFRTVDRALATNGENGTIWVDPRARIVAVAEMVGNQRLPRTIERLRCMYRGAA